MIMAKRNQWDIAAAILKIAENGSRKTRIMYRCNMSYRQLEVYLKFLTGMGFLHNGDDFYSTTQKGIKFVKAYDHMLEILPGEETKQKVESMTHYLRN